MLIIKMSCEFLFIVSSLTAKWNKVVKTIINSVNNNTIGIALKEQTFVGPKN